MAGEKETLEKIHRIAEQEFLEKGFKGASLRNIVKRVGVTTGAFYGYYKSKEELFDALVTPHAEYLKQHFVQEQQAFAQLSEAEQVNQVSHSGEKYMFDVLEYGFAHRNGMRLLLGAAAAGTRYEDFVHQLVELEIQGTHRFMDVLEHMGKSQTRLGEYFEHTVISGMYSAFFELFIHDVPYEEAKECADGLMKFYAAGWMACMGLEQTREK